MTFADLPGVHMAIPMADFARLVVAPVNGRRRFGPGLEGMGQAILAADRHRRLVRARFVAVVRRLRRQRLLERLAVHAEVEADAPAEGVYDSTSDEAVAPAEVDVRALVAAPSAPPRLFAPHSTPEAAAA